jgi:hypothetical protein
MAPLIHRAAADALSVLNAMGRVVIPNVVAFEATYFLDKPFASEVAGWIARGQQLGSNQPVEIAGTDIGALYRLALNQIFVVRATPAKSALPHGWPTIWRISVDRRWSFTKTAASLAG